MYVIRIVFDFNHELEDKFFFGTLAYCHQAITKYLCEFPDGKVMSYRIFKEVQ